ncbi:PBP1A family penicillin-binding protein [Bacillus lacus]|uniref:PBP1A family penicillin-binding protein n=1 Tax=Metabacillus lacus TaxID=1983721 RepID=A0A7X2IWI9_9BACI|nr:PBP1A family penicillin-binding protein [Metabacillus lacus]MRX71117.1 PBP1A family penicillin-binding protein [Metabacillus lacus]
MGDILADRRIKYTLKTIRALLFLGLLAALFLSTVLFGMIYYLSQQGAPSLTVPQSTIVYAGDGSVIGETHNGEKRYWVKLGDISPYLQKATISIEDRSFYKHHGFDYKRIAGAAIADIKAMAKVQGASTITQQYARNLFLVHEKTWKRKMDEALYTLRLEMNYSKEQILEGYLNTIYYGHGAYGIEAAASYYFDKHASELTLSEASMLAGIPKGPGSYSPLIQPEKARQRQQVILQMMVKEGYITAKEADSAFAAELQYRKRDQLEQQHPAPYFQDAAMKSLSSLLGLDEKELSAKGLRIYTTLNPRLQTTAENIIRSTIPEGTELQAGFVAMNPKNGHVEALVGGRDYQESPFNRVTQAERQPGSTMKPFLYYAAVKEGFTPATEMKSAPTVFTYDEGKSTYQPSNYNGYYAEKPITLAQAMALSDNIYAVKTHLFLGMEKLIFTAKTFGITSKLAHVPSLALGTSPVHLLDMTAGYSMLANGGYAADPVFITKVEDSQGNEIYSADYSKERKLDEQAAFVTVHMMKGMFDKSLNGYTKVTGSSISEQLTRSYAGKSGTTETDSWMIGFSPDLNAGVWTGYDKNRTIDHVQEKSYAKQIWASFMEEALKDEPISAFKPPKGVEGVYINPENGKLAGKNCPVRHFAYFVAGTLPVEHCTEHSQESPGDNSPPQQEEAKKSWWQRIFPWKKDTKNPG